MRLTFSLLPTIPSPIFLHAHFTCRLQALQRGKELKGEEKRAGGGFPFPLLFIWWRNFLWADTSHPLQFCLAVQLNLWAAHTPAPSGRINQIKQLTHLQLQNGGSNNNLISIIIGNRKRNIPETYMHRNINMPTWHGLVAGWGWGWGSQEGGGGGGGHLWEAGRPGMHMQQPPSLLCSLSFAASYPDQEQDFIDIVVRSLSVPPWRQCVV